MIGQLPRARTFVYCLVFAGLAVTCQAAESTGEPSMVPPESKSEEPSMAPPEEGGPAAPQSMKAKAHAMGLSGSLRGSYWTSNRRSDSESNIAVGQVWGKFDRKINKEIGLFAEGYLGREDVFGDGIDTNRLREAYVDLRHGAWDFRFGKQIVAWGRTDRLNPTDNITPRDFTLLSPEFDEDRFGSVAAKGAFNWGLGNSITAVWVPVFESHEFSFVNTRSTTYRHTEPSSARQFGLKYDVSGGNIDYSVSYYEGFDLTPDISLAQVTSYGKILDLKHNRIRVIGADAATTVGSNRYAVEGAYTRTQDGGGNDPSIKNPHFYGVFGLEHDFTNNLTGIVQYFYRHVFKYQSPGDINNANVRITAIGSAVLNAQYDQDLHGVSARIGKKWLNETVEGEFAGSTLLNSNGYFLRARVSYIWSDNVKFNVGYEYYKGSSTTSYGRGEQNKALFAECRYFF